MYARWMSVSGNSLRQAIKIQQSENSERATCYSSHYILSVDQRVGRRAGVAVSGHARCFEGEGCRGRCRRSKLALDRGSKSSASAEDED